MKFCINSLMLGLCFLVTSLPAQGGDKAATGIEGYWSGRLNAGFAELRIGLNITREADGILRATIDCPDGGEKDVLVDEVKVLDSTLSLRLNSRKASFKGPLKASSNEIVGIWEQAGRSLDLTLKRTDRWAIEFKRPQTPRKPYPFAEEEVTYKNSRAKVKLAGTLTLPRGASPFPAVLLIAGSGPHDRDETIFEHKPFLLLADHLTRQGIAVLRVDKRGVGQSTGGSDRDTSEDFAEDVVAGLAFLNGRKDIDPRRIGLLGHSEGGMIAPMVAARSKDVAFIVLLAAPGVSGSEILSRQQELVLRASGVGADALKRRMDIQRQAFAIVTAVKDDSEAAKKLRELFSNEEQELKALTNPEMSRDLFIASLQSPWMRFFISFDPQTMLARVTCPILAINGDKDLQIDPRQNLPAIEAALKGSGNKDYTIKVFPKLNHLFQTCETGLPSEYGKIEETIAPAVLDFVADWIKQRSK